MVFADLVRPDRTITVLGTLPDSCYDDRMKHSVGHDLDQEMARKVARRALEGYAQQFSQYNPQVDWRGEDSAQVSFSAKGLSVKGKVDLLPGEIVIDISVPFALKLFQSKAVGVVEREIREWLGKAKRGEID